MLRTYSLRCDTCSFALDAITEKVCVLIFDGREVVLPEGQEIDFAERATGKTWKELDEAGNISRRFVFFCRHCQCLGHYHHDYLYDPCGLTVAEFVQGHVCVFCGRIQGAPPVNYNARTTTSVTLSNGEEEQCLPGVEVLHAQFLTGESWDNLLDSRRLRHFFAHLCQKCGKCNWIGHDVRTCAKPKIELSASLRIPCRKCKQKALIPLPAIEYISVTCPECKGGKLVFTLEKMIIF